MYMEPIRIPKTATRTRSAPVTAKLLAGGILCLLAAVAMPIYWAAVAVWVVVGGFVVGARSLARSGYDCLTYVGEAIVGR